MPILFASRRTSSSDFRRIHDDRTPHVDAAVGAAAPSFSGGDLDQAAGEGSKNALFLSEQGANF
jgi:hypothetical protein